MITIEIFTKEIWWYKIVLDNLVCLIKSSKKVRKKRNQLNKKNQKKDRLMNKKKNLNNKLKKS